MGLVASIIGETIAYSESSIFFMCNVVEVMVGEWREGTILIDWRRDRGGINSNNNPVIYYKSCCSGIKYLSTNRTETRLLMGKES